jgi:hypothetical protein
MTAREARDAGCKERKYMSANESGKATNETNAPAPETAQAAAPQAPPVPPQAPYWQPAPYPAYYQPPPPAPQRTKIIEDSNKPTVVGALLILVGILGIVMWSAGLAGFGIFGAAVENVGTDSSSIHGVVEYTNGTGVVGANVTVIGTAIATVTDDEGNFVLYSVPHGDQRIQVTKPGYTTLVRKVSVSEGSSWDWGWSSGTNSGYTGPKLQFTLAPGTGTTELSGWDGNMDMGMGAVMAILAVCAAVGMVMSVLAIFGGLQALKRRSFGWVVVGCLAGIFTIGFGIGSVLAFVALFVALLASEEFKAKAKTA